MAEGYSQLSLSFQRDKLPAFSGLVSSNLLDSDVAHADRYLAGVRAGHLMEDVPWFVGGFASGHNLHTHLLYAQTARPPAYVAPSWSWASVVDPVHFAYAEGITEVLCEVTKPEVFLSSSAPYGEVGSGQLTAKGKLFPTSWGIEGDEEAPIGYHLWDWQKHEGNNCYAGKHFYPDFMLTKRKEMSIAGELLYVLPLVCLRPEKNVAAIALRRVQGNDNHNSVPVFERVS